MYNYYNTHVWSAYKIRILVDQKIVKFDKSNTNLKGENSNIYHLFIWRWVDCIVREWSQEAVDFLSDNSQVSWIIDYP